MSFSRWLNDLRRAWLGVPHRKQRRPKRKSTPPLRVELLEMREVPAIYDVSSVNVLPEGNSGVTNMTFTITRTGSLTNSSSVGYETFDQTAIAGIDYTATQGRAVFTPGSASVDILVPIFGDGIVESPSESFGFRLFAPEADFMTPSTVTTGLTDSTGSIVNFLRPYAHATADINRDGRPDLIVSGRDAAGSINLVSVMFNSNTTIGGSIASFVPVLQGNAPNVANNPYSIAVGDIDGDNRPDIVVASDQPSANITVLFNSTPVGGTVASFSVMTLSAGPNIRGPQALALTDMNGDNKLDIVTVSQNTTLGTMLSVLVNTRTTVPFSLGFAASQDFALGYQSQSVMVGDFIQESYPFSPPQPTGGAPVWQRPDIAVMGYKINALGQREHIVSIFKNTTLYDTTTAVPVTSNVISMNRLDVDLPFAPTATTLRSDLVAADFDNDGKLDLAASVNGPQNMVAVLRNVTPIDNAIPVFDNALTFTTGITSPFAIQAADFNRDSLPELIVTGGPTSNRTVVLTNSTQSSDKINFTAPKNLVGGNGAIMPVVANFNGDSVGTFPSVDLAVTNQISTSVTTYFNQTDSIGLSTASGVITDDDGGVNVLSITRRNNNPTNAGTVSFTVLFSAPVTGVDITDFAIDAGPAPGVTGATILSVSPAAGYSTTFTVAVTTGSGTGDLSIDVFNDGSISATLGSLITDFTTGDFYSIDRTAPVVTNIIRLNPNPTNVSLVNFLVSFSEDVTGVSLASFAPSAVGLAGSVLTSVVPISPSLYRVTAITGTGQGTLSVNLNDTNVIRDLVGNFLGGPVAGDGNFSSGETYTIDRVNPTVGSIVRADPDPTLAANVGFTVTFSEAVTGVDLSDFSLTTTGLTGSSVQNVTPLSPTTYFVDVATGSGTGTLKLNVVDNDSITDSVGNRLGGAGIGNGNFIAGQAYSVQRSNPAVTAVNRVNPNPTALATVTYTVNFTSAVTGFDTTDLSLVSTGSLTGSSIASLSNVSPGVYNVVVNTGQGVGTLQLNVVDDDTIIDGFSRPLGGVGAGNGAYNVGQIYDVNRPALLPTSFTALGTTPTNAGTVSYRLVFPVNTLGVNASDFTLTTLGSITGASIASVTPASGTTFTINVNTGSGSGTLALNLIDNDSINDGTGRTLNGPGTGSYVLNAPSYTIDRTNPNVLSISRANPNPTNAPVVSYTVVFDDNVTGVDTGDFSLVQTGVTGATILSVIPSSQSTYTVAVNTGTGTGTLGLNLVDNNTIVDTLTNPLGGAGAGNGNFTSGQAYNLLRTPPAVASFTAVESSPTVLNQVHYNVSFTVAVQNVDTSDFVLSSTGLVNTSIASVNSISANLYQVTVNTGTGGNGTLSLSLVDDDSITDFTGNLLGGAGTGNGNAFGPTFTVDHTPPSVLSITRNGATPTAAANVSFTVVFSEPVTGVDTLDFQLDTLGLMGANVQSVTQVSGSTYTVNVLTGTGDGTLSIDLIDNLSIKDVNGNNLTGSFTGGQSYAVDRTAPTAVSLTYSGPSITNAQTVVYTAVFSEAVTGVGTDDFSLAGSSLTAPFVANVSMLTPSTYNITVNTGSGSGNVQLLLNDNNSIVDGIGNTLSGAADGSISGNSLLVDRTFPTVQAATIDASLSTSSTITYGVQFSKDVSGVDLSDFTLALSGSVTGASIAGISTLSPSLYQVTVNTGGGVGTLRLSVLDNDSIRDVINNALGGPGTGNGALLGEVFSINNPIPPKISSIAIDDGTAQHSVVRSITIDFDRAVTIQTGAFTLTRTGFGSVTVGTAVSLPGGKTRVVLTFTGSNVEFSSLKDGAYVLTIVASQIRDASNLPLDGNGDGAGGDNRVVNFNRLFGDSNGDNVITSVDLNSFVAAYGGIRNSPNPSLAAKYRAYFDFDNNGIIDTTDLSEINKRR